MIWDLQLIQSHPHDHYANCLVASYNKPMILKIYPNLVPMSYIVYNIISCNSLQVHNLLVYTDTDTDMSW